MLVEPVFELHGFESGAAFEIVSGPVIEDEVSDFLSTLTGAGGFGMRNILDSNGIEAIAWK
ncbi:hypothetical protein [Microvirga brassicacearum]|uniref:hypothetical protein n=1 Tax=Microvirga brassicacearum TaxID=2580413 RepID=UPI001FCE4533|nr:hypothetical protein [Microvirga brassicacearum]